MRSALILVLIMNLSAGAARRRCRARTRRRGSFARAPIAVAVVHHRLLRRDPALAVGARLSDVRQRVVVANLLRVGRAGYKTCRRDDSDQKSR